MASHGHPAVLEAWFTRRPDVVPRVQRDRQAAWRRGLRRAVCTVDCQRTHYPTLTGLTTIQRLLKLNAVPPGDEYLATIAVPAKMPVFLRERCIVISCGPTLLDG